MIVLTQGCDDFKINFKAHVVLWRQRNVFDMIVTLYLLLNVMGPKWRCSIKSYALKSRYLDLTVQEKREASNYRRWIRQLIIIQAVDGTGAEAAELEEVTEILILMYIKFLYLEFLYLY